MNTRKINIFTISKNFLNTTFEIHLRKTPPRSDFYPLFLFFILVSAITLGGCAGRITADSRFHMINASPNGDAHAIEEKKYTYFIPGIEGADEVDEWSTVGEEFHQHLDGIIDNLDTYQKSRRQEGKDTNLLIYVHGGLNTLETSIARATEQYKPMLQEGTYPVFINWRSGPFTSYFDHLFRIRDGEIKKKNAAASSLFYLATDVLGVVSKIPEAWVEQGSDSVVDTLGREDSTNEELVVGKSQVKVLHSDVSSRPVLDSIGKGSLWAVTSPFKLVTTSAAYAFGKPAWDIMVRRSRELLIRSCEFYEGDHRCNSTKAAHADASSMFGLYGVTSHAELRESEASKLVCKTGSREPVCSGALSVFIKKLIESKCNGNSNDSCPDTITVIGHSMGAIVVAELLRFFPHLKYDNVVFMGAAATSRDALSSLPPYMQEHRNTKFYNLSLHPHAEDTETNFWGLVPNGSLLTWIDSMYGLPENEIDKTFGQWINARQTARLIPVDVAERMHFRVFGFGEGEPRKHGEFDKAEFRYWRPEFWGEGKF